MTNRKNRPISWAETNASDVIEEAKKRKQSLDVYEPAPLLTDGNGKKVSGLLNRPKKNTTESEGDKNTAAIVVIVCMYAAAIAYVVTH